jgi:hypothetical protein
VPAKWILERWLSGATPRNPSAPLPADPAIG